MTDSWSLLTLQFAARFGDRSGARSWFVPGRIEVFGKHVDYAGGRSLLAAVDRGFHVLARPRSDNRVHLVDARSRQAFAGSLDAALPQQPGTWSDYPITVLRRIARDFPAARKGMDAVIMSTLPSAAGLSSSSALVIATFLPLVAFNALEQDLRFQEHCTPGPRLADYLGAVENGRAFGPFDADFGVGTQGGSQDHSAIICCRQGEIAQVRFRPTELERQVTFPDDWRLVIAASGVPAPKGGAVREHYNALANDTATLIDAWNRSRGARLESLLRILESGSQAESELSRLIDHLPDAERLRQRLAQFREETTGLIPAAVAALEDRDLEKFGALVDRSARIGDRALANQVDATRDLCRLANDLGAAGASGFGAGFGGSVHAVVNRDIASSFARKWREEYRRLHPALAERSEFLVVRPGDGAREVAVG